jgi:hypothetical protein
MDGAGGSIPPSTATHDRIDRSIRP